MTQSELECILAWILIGILYIFRNSHPTLKTIWYYVRLFFIILFATLFANYAKDKIKDWWKK